MTSLIAAGGSGRSTNVMPAVPAASSVTTIAFIRHHPRVEFSPARRSRRAHGERKFPPARAFALRDSLAPSRSRPMLPLNLSPDDVRALARMARGGVYLDPDGRGVFAGRPVIDRPTVSALA